MTRISTHSDDPSHDKHGGGGEGRGLPVTPRSRGLERHVVLRVRVSVGEGRGLVIPWARGWPWGRQETGYPEG